MSGFEVVGIVLGSIPLLISALEHYSDGVSTIKSMTDYETVFENLHTSFVTSLTIYRQSCEELLGPLMLPDSNFYELLENHHGDAWKDEELGKRLRERLGTDYPPYKSSVRQLNKKIVLFSQKLKLCDDMRPSWVTSGGTINEKLRQNFFKNPWIRIKGGFDSNKYAKLLAEIDRDINQLHTLTKGAESLEPIRLDRKRRANAAYWIDVRDQARRLFEALRSRWSCSCPCRHPHRAHLRLDVRSGKEVGNSTTRFGLLFSFDVNAAVAASLPWNWRDIEIEPFQAPNNQEMVIPSAQLLAKKTAHFSPSVVLSSPAPTSPRMPPPSATRIDDLCEILRRKIQTTCCLGFIDDQPWQHHMYSVTRHTPGDRRPASLQEIVYREDSTYLSIKDKCTIALTLASAVLQLHDTPWLSECWGMNDIHLITGGVSLIDQPYVSRSFAPTLGSQQSPQPRSRHFVQNEMIFALGIALLELSYGQPILSLKTAGDLDSQGNETNFTEFSIASRLIEAINTRELPNYAKVVVRCIRCNFDTFICSLDNDEFRERFYQGVIVPLQKDYEYATSTSGP